MNVLQKTYQFMLVLKNADEGTPNLEDSLYEAGCDDALINFRNGTVYLDFDRKANSFEQAVLSAIRDVENASIKAVVINVAPEDMVTESEIAKRLLINRQTVSLWIKGERRQSFPKPTMKLADKSPFWKWREVVKWLFDNKVIGTISEEDVKNALFLETLNIVLEERDTVIKEARNGLIKKMSEMGNLNAHRESNQGDFYS
jgi:hypothetical protein